MKDSLHHTIIDTLKARSSWEDRQRLWYEMRHQGLRRKHKPWQHAADLHYPLADTLISKLKPFYYQQLFGMDVLAMFVSQKNQNPSVTTMASQWFDFKLKNYSNLEREVLTCIDHMLMSGMELMKVYWDHDKDQVQFEAIDPLNIIVPNYAQDIQETDWLVHIQSWSKEAYQRNSLFKQDEVLLEQISGKGYQDVYSPSYQRNQNKYLREGITYGRDDEEIILWEVYQKTEKGWSVCTYSPVAPEVLIREEFLLPYEHKKLPFVAFQTEIKDKGFYSPRGVPELVAAFESSLNKMWNEKHDAMTLYNRPVYMSETPVANPGNIRLQPGQILPYRIQPMIQQAPPVSWDEEMRNTRLVAENLIGLPDFGLSSMDASAGKTATEVMQISGLMGVNVDLRARIFRKSLSDLYRIAWHLYMQYDQECLEFYYDTAQIVLPKEALHGDYLIEPSGSPDGLNRLTQIQKANSRWNMFANHPLINQEELVKSILEIDDPKLVKRLLKTTPNSTMTDALEDQANEINLMLIGFPAQVKPEDMDALHLDSLDGFIRRRIQLGENVKADTAQLLIDHIQLHLQQLKAKDIANGQNYVEKMQIILQVLEKAKAISMPLAA